MSNDQKSDESGTEDSVGGSGLRRRALLAGATGLGLLGAVQLARDPLQLAGDKSEPTATVSPPTETEPTATATATPSTPTTAAPSYDETLYVDATTGDDSNSGTESEPLETIQAAMDEARTYKDNGKSVKVTVAAGTYREYVVFKDGGDGPEVVVEGAGPDQTQIKGSEVYENWTEEGDGVYSHDWAYSWGVADDPEGGYITDCSGYTGNFCADEPDLVLRREIVFVDGQRLRQVLNEDDLEPGTYYVEDGNKIYLQPPSGVSIPDTTVEVGERGQGWRSTGENNVTLRGVSVRQVATPWKKGLAAVNFAGNNHVIENVTVANNNYNGIFLYGEGNTVWNFTSNRNGHSGINTFRIKNTVFENGVVNKNNWRGHLGGYTGWSPGNKLYQALDTTIRNCTFANNKSKGLWLDNGIKNMTVENVEVRDNLLDNMWVEKATGPVTLDRVVSSGSSQYGLVQTNSKNLTIKNCAVVDNQRGGLMVGGNKGALTLTDWVTEEEVSIRTEKATIKNSILSGVDGDVKAGGGNKVGRFLVGTLYAGSDWDDWVNTYEGTNNIWYESERDDAFEWELNELLDFETWQQRTGQDGSSVFAPFAVRGTGDSSASPGGEGTLLLAGREVETLTVSEIPTDWTLLSSDPDGGTVTDTIASDGEVSVNYDSNQGYVNAQVTFSLPSDVEEDTQQLQVVGSQSDGSSTSTSAELAIQ